jgi:voltage-gated potassium channel
MIREELDRLLAVEERHRRLLARLLIAVGLTVAVAVAGSILIYVFESGKKGGDVHGFGDAVFFTLVQLLTVSSSLSNPVTGAGKVVDVVLEARAIFVVTAVAGSFASFFTSADSS